MLLYSWHQIVNLAACSVLYLFSLSLRYHNLNRLSPWNLFIVSKIIHWCKITNRGWVYIKLKSLLINHWGFWTLFVNKRLATIITIDSIPNKIIYKWFNKKIPLIWDILFYVTIEIIMDRLKKMFGFFFFFR